jgi:hypothetical protein
MLLYIRDLIAGSHVLLYVGVTHTGIPLFLLGWYFTCWNRLLASQEGDEDQDDKFSLGVAVSKCKMWISWAQLKVFGERKPGDEHKSREKGGLTSTFCSCFDVLFVWILQAVHWLMNNNPKQYLKIILSFFQVAGNLFTKLETPWPPFLLKIWKVFEFLTMEIFSLPGYDCVFGDFTTLERMQLTTLGPAVAVGLLSCPFLVSQCGYRKSRRRVLLDNLYNSIMWLTYIMYPLMCVTCLQNYPCIKVDGECCFYVYNRAQCDSVFHFFVTACGYACD